MKHKYQVVDTETLIAKLGSQCSPIRGAYYVIGPDINGRLCHVSTHQFGNASAIQKAKELNEKREDK
ncbi:MAG: hypothetical protein ACR2PH_07740 [Desulfobulbia bacterium]